MVNELNQTNYLREPKFDFWVEQFLTRLYLPSIRTLDCQSPIPMESNDKR